ncbi:MAG: hypothetical protein GF308_12995 [Candidatus Heimdallarchaeota archaeon]|nr:hypothetical protein [Candidatus Heimdallarchaeota archaeon]
MVLNIMDLPIAFTFALAYTITFLLFIRIISQISTLIQSRKEQKEPIEEITTQPTDQITPQSFEQLFLQAFYILVFGLFGVFLMLSYPQFNSSSIWIVITVLVLLFYGFIFVVDWLKFRKKRRKQKELREY